MTAALEGDLPLAKATWENFASLVATGVAGGAAWAQATGKIESDAACRVQSTRLLKRQEITTRIKYLRAKVAEAADGPISNSSLAELMEEVSETLRNIHEVCRVTASPQQLLAIRKCLTTHAGRSWRVPAPSGAEAEVGGMDIQDALSRLRGGVCDCGAGL